MPRSASPIFYSFGFIVSTSLIHLTGVLIGYLFTHRERFQQANAYFGTAVTVAGLVILYRL
jgi:urease accessory protein